MYKLFMSQINSQQRTKVWWRSILLLLSLSSFHSIRRTAVVAMASSSSSPSSSSTASSVQQYNSLHQHSKRYIHPYQAPPWVQSFILSSEKIPTGRLRLGHLPTPLYRLLVSPQQTSSSRSSIPDNPSWLHEFLSEESNINKNDGDNNINDDIITSRNSSNKNWNIRLWIKRDDMSGGLEVGGNKIRKLEFLLAHALQQQPSRQHVVTIGGIQSNHCRATAAAARMIGLTPHLILRCPPPIQPKPQQPSFVDHNKNNNDIHSLVGNLLVDRMVGSHIYSCTPGEYGRVGADELLKRVGQYVQDTFHTDPYLIPVGGSNAIGSWGYIEAVREVLEQWKDISDLESSGTTAPPSSSSSSSIDHIVLACGSGGTAAGVCLGMALAHGVWPQQQQQQHPSENVSPSNKMPHIHAVGVCDDPDYFYHHIAQIASDLGLILPPSGDTSATSLEDFLRQHMTIYQGKGLGYAVSTADELQFVADFGRDTGIVLDPVYTGKALFHFVQHVLLPNPESFRNSNILFWHTGGGLGLYDKVQDLLSSVESASPIQPLNVYGSAGSDGINIARTPS